MPENFDEYDCIDKILSRYHNIEFVMNLPMLEGINLLGKMNIAIAEERLFQQWNVEHLHMEKKKYMTFEQYKNKVFGSINTNVNISKKMTVEEAIADAEKISEMYKKEQKAGDTVG